MWPTTQRSLPLVASVLGLAAVCVSATAQQKPLLDRPGVNSGSSNPFTDEFADFAKKTINRWKVPGLSIAVIDGEDVYAEGYGFATLPDTPATPETLWYGASTSKAQVAATLAHLIDTKQYPSLAKGWATPISSIIRDDFVLQDEWATNHITLDDAVSHRTGLGGHDMANMRERNGTQLLPKDIVRSLRNLGMIAEPRTLWSYNNNMFVTIGHAIETITGKWLGDVLRENLWKPLGMNSTYFEVKDAQDAPEHFAAGYYWDEKAEEYAWVPYMVVTDVGAAGAVISNVLDYAKWIKCLLYKEAPFSQKTHDDIRTPRTMIAPRDVPAMGVPLYGLGWIRVVHHGHVVYTHSGGMHAYGAEVYWLPEAQYGVVAFGNTATTSNAAEEVLGWHLIDEKLGIPKEDRFDFDAKWQASKDRRDEAARDALNRTFPDRPEHPLPSTVPTSELVGTYHDAGYGTITLREEDHPDKPHQKVLVADRPETTWQYRLVLHHVSADYWIVYSEGLHQPDGESGSLAMPGKFNIHVSGKVSGLEIDWRSLQDQSSEGTIVFERVE